jgi:hypothetical protein
MMSLSIGALITGFHGTQWSGLPAIVTFIGYAQLLKGLVHMTWPAHSLRSMSYVTHDKSYKFAVAGAIMIPIALLILVNTYR